LQKRRLVIDKQKQQIDDMEYSQVVSKDRNQNHECIYVRLKLESISIVKSKCLFIFNTLIT
jgi:hypothetical protein